MKRKEKKKENKNKKQLVSSETTALLEAEHRRISTQLVATRNQLPTIPWRIPKYLRNNTLLRHKFCKVLNPSLSLSFSPFQTGKEKNHRYSSPLSPPSLKRVVPKIAIFVSYPQQGEKAKRSETRREKYVTFSIIRALMRCTQGLSPRKSFIRG